jgi:DNA polymerase-3 subunit delta'
MFEDFSGNRQVADTLEHALDTGRVPQTILLAGPAGVGKATLARRFASRVLGETRKIERDDLSLPDNAALIADREKWPADKRNDDPLLFASHPDFVTFAPDGPLRQISIQQMRLLRERAQYKPLRGSRRVFLIDHLDRANEQAANSLLKTLEEPPDHLIILMTAENAWDLLPTIRSRAVIFQMTPLRPEEMAEFMSARGLKEIERRTALAAGCPGVAVSMDLEAYDARRTAMLALLRAGAGLVPFAQWVRHSEAIGAKRSEKLDASLKVLYLLLSDMLALQNGAAGIRNADIRSDIEAIAARVDFRWIEQAVRRVDEMVEQLRRNIQKGIALDALVVDLRARAPHMV